MKFAEQLRNGETIFTIWSTIGAKSLVRLLALNDFGGIVVDMQHGSHTDDTIVEAIDAIVARNKAAIVRLPVNRFDAASRALDLGYEAVIAPMINSKKDAEDFASYMKYPPLGTRSWGPVRASQLHEISTPDYLKIGNEKTLAFAMIETRDAFENFDDIIDVDGIDGIFVGPSDLSLTFLKGARVDVQTPEVVDAIKDMAKRAKDKGKLAGIFAGTPETAKTYTEFGYNFVNISSDVNLIKAGSNEFLAKAK